MATITKNTGNGKYKVMLTPEELNTVTIALALINHIDVEEEMAEQGLGVDDVVNDHLKLFKPFAKVTKLYPQKKLEDIVSKLDGDIIDQLNAIGTAPLAISFQESLVNISSDTITLKAEDITVDEGGYSISNNYKWGEA